MSATIPPGWGASGWYGSSYAPETRVMIPAGSPYGPPMTLVPTTPRQGPELVVALVAIVVAALALAVAFFAFVLAGSGGFPGDPGYTGAYSLSGKLATTPATAAGVSAADLQRSLTLVLEKDGNEVEALACPATARVAQGIVTPCRATLDGDAWDVIVIFENATGSYLALVS